MKNTKRDQSAVARHIRAFTGLCMLAMPASQAVTGCTAQGPATLSEGNVGQTEQALTTCVTIRRGNGTVADARLSKDAKNQNFGNNPVLQVGEDDHTLVRFDLSDIPSSAVINSATLKVYAHGGGNGGQCGEDEDDDDGKIRIHRAKNAWAENTVTYKNFNNQYDNAVSGTLVGHNHTALQSANVKTLVAQWVSGAKPNYGFLLENKDGDDKTNFTSSEGNNASLRPALEVCYTTPDDNHCSPNPCVHGACTNAPDGYSCACDAGWSGTNCDTNINDCAASPCQNGGTCTDDVGGYSCSCPAGYTGTNCEYDIDECASSPCVNGDCTDLVNGYTCSCNPGFSGTNCETNIDDCAGAPCQNGGTCTDDVGGYSCSCPAGYTGANCEYEIDECASSPCVNGMCIDQVNSYECVCNPGFGGADCSTNIDECAGNPCQNGGTCTDGIFSYTCSCPAGYTGDNCEIDIDECASQPCVNGDCVDQVNAYECGCQPGWTGGLCEIEIDECESMPCVNGQCVDHVNGYECGCAPGWTGGLCEIEIDECESMPCVNGQCVDQVNGYECGCAPGWTGGLCEIEIDECESMPCVNGQCVDQVNGYECSCDPGWSGTNCETQAAATCPCTGSNYWLGGTVTGCGAWSSDSFTLDGSVEAFVDLYTSDGNGGNQFSTGYFSASGPGGGAPYDATCYGYINNGSQSSVYISGLSVAQVQACAAELQAAAVANGYSCF